MPQNEKNDEEQDLKPGGGRGARLIASTGFLWGDEEPAIFI